jgi:2-polyprenyl-6-methoxyphenol hydroxylase-like FAD-dependent oxidoreductase
MRAPLRAIAADPRCTASADDELERSPFLDPDGGNGQVQAMPQAFTSWEAIYTTLRSGFPSERYHMGAALAGTEPCDGRVAVEIDGVGRFDADLLVCADGAQSATRRRLLPDVTPQAMSPGAARSTSPMRRLKWFDSLMTPSPSARRARAVTF